jgi:hypothetical protein
LVRSPSIDTLTDTLTIQERSKSAFILAAASC